MMRRGAVLAIATMLVVGGIREQGTSRAFVNVILPGVVLWVILELARSGRLRALKDRLRRNG